MIKIDVERAEHDVLLGARSLLERSQVDYMSWSCSQAEMPSVCSTELAIATGSSKTIS